MVKYLIKYGLHSHLIALSDCILDLAFNKLQSLSGCFAPEQMVQIQVVSVLPLTVPIEVLVFK